METMKALVLKVLEICPEQVPIPHVKNPDDVLLKTR